MKRMLACFMTLVFCLSVGETVLAEGEVSSWADLSQLGDGFEVSLIPVESKWDWIHDFSEDGILVSSRGNGNTQRLIGLDGTVKFETDIYSLYHFSEGLAPASSYGAGGTYGYLDTDGKVSVPFIFEHASNFSSGLACVTMNGNELYIDKSGKCVYQAKQEERLGNFENGYAVIAQYDKDSQEEGASVIQSRIVDTAFHTVYEVAGGIEIVKVSVFGIIVALASDVDNKETIEYAVLSFEGTIQMKLPFETITETSAIIDQMVDFDGEKAVVQRYEIPLDQIRSDGGWDQQAQVKRIMYCIDSSNNISNWTELITNGENFFQGEFGPDLYLLNEYSYKTGGGTLTFYNEAGSQIAQIPYGGYEPTEYSPEGKLLLVPQNTVDGKRNLCLIESTAQDMKQVVLPQYSYLDYPQPNERFAVFKVGDNRVGQQEGLMVKSSMPYLDQGRLMVNAKDFSNALGINQGYDYQQTVSMTDKTNRVLFHLGGLEMKSFKYNAVDKAYITEPIPIDTPAVEWYNMKFVPIRYIAEAFDFHLYYDETMDIAVVSRDEICNIKEVFAEYQIKYQAGVFPYGEYPRIDGSTATIPYSEAVTENLLGISKVSAREQTHHTKTSNAFHKLIDGNCDVVLAVEPSEEVLVYAAEKGVTFEQYPFAKEGFVFLLNEENPVSSLTQDQIRGIYTGEITNWNQVGGDDAAIIAFQRNADSGSQELMRQVVMRDIPMMEPPKEQKIGTMGQIIDSVSDYDNAKYSIGYSIYYYFTEMHSHPGVKLAAVDGIAPSKETITDGSYPLTTNYSAFVRSDEEQGSPARRVMDFIQSDEGARLAEECGFIIFR